MRASAFTVGAAALTSGMSTMTGKLRAEEATPSYKTQLKIGFIVGAINDDQMAHIAEIGADGVETTVWDIDVDKAREARKIAEANNVKIHSVMRAWTNFNQPDSVVADIESVKRALRAAAAYGASTILLVPCRTGVAAPAPWDFQIEYDPETLLVSKVCEGDNEPYQEYIKQQNIATEVTYRCMEELIPVAAYEGVTIGLENVWNGLWCTPQFYSDFVRSIGSVWVKEYFDLGNHVKYARTEDWLLAGGGATITKLHIKDFLFDKDKPSGGEFVPIGKGSIDWKSVRDTIEQIGYNGFVTLESGGYTDEQHVQIFKNFFNGVPVLNGVE